MIVCRKNDVSQATLRPARERWTNIGNANIEKSEIEEEKAVEESCGLCCT